MAELDKKTADEIMALDGEVRGVALKTDEKFVLENGGREKLREIEEEIRALGYSIDYKTVNTMRFYPIGLRLLSLLAIAKSFNMDEEGVEKMGFSAPKFSLIIRTFLRYFASVEMTMKQVSAVWGKHYTKGSVNIVEINEKEKKVTVSFKETDFHPLFCAYLRGYLLRMTEIIVKKPVKGEEIECFFNGGKNHTFSFRW